MPEGPRSASCGKLAIDVNECLHVFVKNPSSGCTKTQMTEGKGYSLTSFYVKFTILMDSTLVLLVSVPTEFQPFS